MRPFGCFILGAFAVFIIRTLVRALRSGVIFSDGIEADFMVFNSGMEAVIEPADRQGRLIT